MELPPDTFHNYQHEILSVTHTYDLPPGVDAERMVAAGKQLQVMLYGKLGMSQETHVGRAHVTECIQDAWGYVKERLEKNPSQGVVFREFCDPADESKKYYLYAMTNTQRMLEHNVPIMLQVQGWLNIHGFEMWQQIGGIPLFRKCDAWQLKSNKWAPIKHHAKPVRTVDVSRLPRFHTDDCINSQIVQKISTWGTYHKEEKPNTQNRDLRVCDMSHRYLQPKPWVDHDEIYDSAQWKDIAEVAKQHGGVLVIAEPGCGKTYVAKQLRSMLKHGYAQVALAPTHKASNNLEGITIHSFVGANNNIVTKRKGELYRELQQLPEKAMIIVDEGFMVGEFLWYCNNVVARMLPDAIWVVLGDPRQLSPPGERGRISYDYTHHPTLMELTGHQRIILTKSYRCDEKLRAISKSVYDDPDFNMTAHFLVYEPGHRLTVGNVKSPRHTHYPPSTYASALLKALCGAHSFIGHRPTTVNLAWTNAVVFQVNAHFMELHKPEEGAVFIEAIATDDRTQDVWLYKGLPLISCKTTKVKEKPELPEDASFMDKLRALIDIQNNESFEVEKVEGSLFTTKSLRTAKIRQWEVADFHKNFRVAYCITVDKSQGDTIKVDFTIWEYGRMSKSMLYTAITRAERAEQVHLGSLPGSGYTWRMLENLKRKINGYKRQDKGANHDICDVTPKEFADIIYACGRKCKHCGQEVKVMRYEGTHDKLQVTLDRKDNTKGHKRDNVVVACLGCNESHLHEECVQPSVRKWPACEHELPLQPVAAQAEAQAEAYDELGGCEEKEEEEEPWRWFCGPCQGSVASEAEYPVDDTFLKFM